MNNPQLNQKLQNALVKLEIELNTLKSDNLALIKLLKLTVAELDAVTSKFCRLCNSPNAEEFATNQCTTCQYLEHCNKIHGEV